MPEYCTYRYPLSSQCHNAAALEPRRPESLVFFASPLTHADARAEYGHICRARSHRGWPRCFQLGWSGIGIHAFMTHSSLRLSRQAPNAHCTMDGSPSYLRLQCGTRKYFSPHHVHQCTRSQDSGTSKRESDIMLSSHEVIHKSQS